MTRATNTSMSRFCPACGQCYDDETTRCPDDDAALQLIGDGDDPMVGNLIGGRFRLVESIGSGGFGKVYRAIQLSMKREVAVKILRREFNTDVPHYERFVREATLASSIRHPNVVSPIDFGQDAEESLTYLVMEYIDGVDLGYLLDGWRLSPELALDILYQTCGGLSDAHRQGIIHRDLKPRNLRLSVVSDGSLQVKVLDLGIAKPKDADKDITKQEDRVGTTAFLAPEYLVHGQLTAHSDQYALGILLYLMLTGKKPFVGNDHQVMFQHIQSEPPPISAALPQGESVPEEIEQLHRILAAKKPSDRFEDVRTVRERIEEIRDRHKISTIKIDEPPESVTIDIFSPWMIETEELEELEVQSLPSDLISELEGAGAEVVADSKSGRKKRIVLPTPPPMPADRSALGDADGESSSGLPLPRPGKLKSRSKSGLSLPRPGKAKSRSGADSSSGLKPLFPKPGKLKSSSEEDSSSGPMPSLPKPGKSKSSSEEDSSSGSLPSVPKLKAPSLGAKDSEASPSIPEKEEPQSLEDSETSSVVADEESSPELTAPSEEKGMPDAPKDAEIAGGEHSDVSDADDILDLDEAADEEFEIDELPHQAEQLSADDSKELADVLRRKPVLAGIAAGLFILVVAGVSLAMFTGEEQERDDLEQSVAENPEPPSDSTPSAGEEAEANVEEEQRADDDSGLSPEELEQSLEAAQIAGEEIARDFTAQKGREVAEQIKRLEQERARARDRRTETSGSDEGEIDDPLDRLLQEVGRP